MISVLGRPKLPIRPRMPVPWRRWALPDWIRPGGLPCTAAMQAIQGLRHALAGQRVHLGGLSLPEEFRDVAGREGLVH